MIIQYSYIVGNPVTHCFFYSVCLNLQTYAYWGYHTSCGVWDAFKAEYVNIILTNMNKHAVTCLSFCLTLLFWGGSISSSFAQQQIVAGGGVATGTGGQMSYTFGQMAYSLQISPSFSLLASIQQPGGVVTFPIELIYFRATTRGSSVELSWATASELNNNYFTLEKSTDGLSWEALQDIPSAGNSQEITRYKQMDHSPFLGTSFYRLKQTDLDGTFSYSGVVSTEWDSPEIWIYPNPVKDYLVLFAESNLSDLSYRLYDAKGTAVKSESIHSVETLIDLAEIPPGLYHLQVNTTNEVLKTSTLIKH